MKPLTTYLNEDFKISKETDKYAYHPKTNAELRELLLQYDKQYEDRDDVCNLNMIDVSNVDTFESLFDRLDFKHIDVSGWNTSKVLTMTEVFANCKQLQTIKGLENWDVHNVIFGSGMFKNCKKLTDVGDLSEWRFNQHFSGSNLFTDCKELSFVGNTDYFKSIDTFKNYFIGTKITY